MKRFFELLLILFCASTLSAADFRLDISGLKGATLKPVSASEEVSVIQASWRGKQKDQLLSCTVTVGKEWKKYSFCFMPKQSGKFNISIMSTKPKDFIDCDNVTAAGVELKNGNFEQLNAKGDPANWIKMKNARISTAGGVDDSKYVSTTHDDRWVQTISCKKGELVTITFYARSAK